MPNKTKVCSTCKKEKPVSGFYKNKHRKDGFHNACSDCTRKSNGRYRKSEKGKQAVKNHHKKQKKYMREYSLRIRYGLTLMDYNRMWVRQKGFCPICKKHQSEISQKLNVDHNHISNNIRGLLCPQCNLALGALSVDERGIECLENAINYLKATDGS